MHDGVGSVTLGDYSQPYLAVFNHFRNLLKGREFLRRAVQNFFSTLAVCRPDFENHIQIVVLNSLKFTYYSN